LGDQYDDGSRRLFGRFDRRPTGYVALRSVELPCPGVELEFDQRLLDAYLLTREEVSGKAEQLNCHVFINDL
jgi:hypothetical protein